MRFSAHEHDVLITELHDAVRRNVLYDGLESLPTVRQARPCDPRGSRGPF